MKKVKLPKIFFGWWTVITGGIVTLWVGGYNVYGFSALFKPISSELGLSRAATSVSASISRLEGGLESMVAGWVIDKFGPKWVIVLGIFLAGLSLMLMYFVNSLWAYYVVWGVMLGTGNNLGTSMPFDVAISNWFVKKRGRALSVKWFLSGLSGGVILTLVAWLIIKLGWRLTCFVGGVVTLLVGLPLALLFVRNKRPEYYGLLPDGAKTKEEVTDAKEMIARGIKYAEEVGEIEFTLRQAIRTPAFWLLIVSNAVHSLAMPTINIHAVPFLTDIGVKPLQAAATLSMMILVGLPFRLVGGFLADRVRKNQIRFLVGGAYFLQGLGFALFLMNQTIGMVYVWFIVYGIGNGLVYGLGEPMRVRYFGRKALGSIRGASMMLMTPVGIAAPVYAGWVYDTTGSYITAFTLVAILLFVAAFIMVMIRPPKPPAHIAEVGKTL